MTNRFKKISTILFCIYVVAVVLLCIIKTDSLPELPRNIFGIPLDKLTHFTMFFPFPILGYCAFYPTAEGYWRKAAVLAILFIIGCAFALSTERLQAMTSYRSCELLDMVADGVGLLAGSLTTLIYIATRHK